MTAIGDLGAFKIRTEKKKRVGFVVGIANQFILEANGVILS